MNDGTTTSSLSPTPAARRAVVSASVPLTTPTTWADAQILGKLPFKRLHVRAEDVAAVVAHRSHALVELGAQGGQGGGGVEEGDEHGMRIVRDGMEPGPQTA